MPKPDQSLTEMAERIRQNSLRKGVSPERRKEAVRVAKNLDALARHKAKKGQAAV